MEFARREDLRISLILGQPPFGLITPTKQNDLARCFNQTRTLSGGVLLSPK